MSVTALFIVTLAEIVPSFSKLLIPKQTAQTLLSMFWFHKINYRSETSDTYTILTTPDQDSDPTHLYLFSKQRFVSHRYYHKVSYRQIKCPVLETISMGIINEQFCIHFRVLKLIEYRYKRLISGKHLSDKTIKIQCFTFSIQHFCSQLSLSCSLFT